MEKEIKLVCGESIDEVVDMLLKEKENEVDNKYRDKINSLINEISP